MNVDPASDAVNANVAFGCVVGPEVMVVLGATESAGGCRSVGPQLRPVMLEPEAVTVPGVR